jgi:hypothetical protein
MNRGVLRPLLAALLLAQAARAEDVWVWTDASGEVHYTNESASIPEKYRSSARSLGGEKVKAEAKAEPPPPATGSTEPEPKAPPAETAQPQPPPPEPIEIAERAPEPDDKVTEEQWRSMFRKASERVRRSERQAQRTREALARLPGEDYTTSYDQRGNLVVNSRYQALKLQLGEDERALEDARENLHDLERAAAREAIPLEWRR